MGGGGVSIGVGKGGLIGWKGGRDENWICKERG